jgi:hypothetical protein
MLVGAITIASSHAPIASSHALMLVGAIVIALDHATIAVRDVQLLKPSNYAIAGVN